MALIDSTKRDDKTVSIRIILLGRFVREIENVLDNCKLEIDFLEEDFWRVCGAGGHSFAMKQSAVNHYYNALNLLREHLGEKYIGHAGYFDKNYDDFIMKQKISGGDLEAACKNWLEELQRRKLQDFKLLMPISYWDSEIEIDDIKITKSIDATLKRDFSSELKDFMTVERLKERTGAETFAIVDVKAFDKLDVRNIGYKMVERLVHAIKLIEPLSAVQFGRNRTINLNEIALISNEYVVSMSSHTIPMRTTLDESLRYYRNHWNILRSFLYSKKLTNLQEVIIRALYWFGVSNTHTDSTREFLHCLIGLESIILHCHHGRGKSDPFEKNYEKVFSKTDWMVLKEIYIKRNNIVHGGSAHVYENEIEKMKGDLRSILLRLIYFTTRYTELKDVFKKEYNLDL